MGKDSVIIMFRAGFRVRVRVRLKIDYVMGLS